MAFIFLLVAGIPAQPEESEDGAVPWKARHLGVTESRAARIAGKMNARPYCDAAVDPATGEGTFRPEDEPWNIQCKACKKALPTEMFES